MKFKDIFNRRVNKMIEDDEHEKFMKESYRSIFEMQNKMKRRYQPKGNFKKGDIIVVRVDAFASVPCNLITEITNIYPNPIPNYYIKTLNPNRVAPMIVEEYEIRIANDKEQFLYHIHGPCVLDEVDK